MNNQLFHIMNHWALEKNCKKNLRAVVYFPDKYGKNLFLLASPVFTMEKRFFHLLAKTCQPC